MNKKILIVLLLTVLLFSLCACGQTDYLQKLDKMVNAHHKTIQVTVSVQKQGESVALESKYMFMFNEGEILVNYSVEEYQSITLDGDNITLPEQQIVTKTGSCKIVDGQVFQQTGEAVDVDLTKIGNLSVRFYETYLDNVKVENDLLTADVVRISGFLGTELTCSDAKVSANVKQLNGFSVTYVEGQNNVKITYKLS